MKKRNKRKEEKIKRELMQDLDLVKEREVESKKEKKESGRQTEKERVRE